MDVKGIAKLLLEFDSCSKKGEMFVTYVRRTRNAREAHDIIESVKGYLGAKQEEGLIGFA